MSGCLGVWVPGPAWWGFSVVLDHLVGVGLLFEIWIVDASIFVVVSSFDKSDGIAHLARMRALPTFGCGGVGVWVICRVVVLLCGCWLAVWWCGCVVVCGWCCCVTSCEGHMVDALASRADEGRRSLR